MPEFLFYFLKDISCCFYKLEGIYGDSAYFYGEMKVRVERVVASVSNGANNISFFNTIPIFYRDVVEVEIEGEYFCTMVYDYGISIV